MRKSVFNILNVYHQASGDSLRQGLSWYHDAQLACLTAVPSTPEKATAIVAALSPGLRWERNLMAAERVYQGKPLNGLGVRWYDGVNKAKQIMRGDDPREVLGGNKVHAFWQCLLHPNTSLSVCVDGHAYAVWKGRRISTNNVPQISDKLYHKISRDYVEAATHIGIAPSQMQAVTWVVWRNLYGGKRT